MAIRHRLTILGIKCSGGVYPRLIFCYIDFYDVNLFYCRVGCAHQTRLVSSVNGGHSPPYIDTQGLGIKASDIDMNKIKPNKISGDSIQAVIEVYKKDVDRSLIRQNLKLTVEERLLNLEKFVQFAEQMRRAGKQLQPSGIARK